MAKRFDLTEKHKQCILSLAKKGCTDKEIYTALKISHSTYYELGRRYPEIFATISEYRRPINKNVEAALYKRCVGYQYTEKKVTNSKKNGRTIEVATKELAPDTSAIKFWLENRSPKRWRRKINLEHTADSDLMKVLSELFDKEGGKKND